jgi:hypothetical protein
MYGFVGPFIHAFKSLCHVLLPSLVIRFVAIALDRKEAGRRDGRTRTRIRRSKAKTDADKTGMGKEEGMERNAFSCSPFHRFYYLYVPMSSIPEPLATVQSSSAVYTRVRSYAEWRGSAKGVYETVTPTADETMHWRASHSIRKLTGPFDISLRDLAITASPKTRSGSTDTREETTECRENVQSRKPEMDRRAKRRSTRSAMTSGPSSRSLLIYDRQTITARQGIP